MAKLAAVCRAQGRQLQRPRQRPRGAIQVSKRYLRWQEATQGSKPRTDAMQRVNTPLGGGIRLRSA